MAGELSCLVVHAGDVMLNSKYSMETTFPITVNTLATYRYVAKSNFIGFILSIKVPTNWTFAVFTSLHSPLPSDTGLGHEICFDQYDTSKHSTSRGVINICILMACSPRTRQTIHMEREERSQPHTRPCQGTRKLSKATLMYQPHLLLHYGSMTKHSV